jgi:hypothetical protein
MGYSINKINSFAEAEQRYKQTKRIISKRHTVEQDVRPIGDRTRKWERIIKVNDNCYALSCGGRADPVFTWGVGDPKIREQYPITDEEIARLSPIVWRKHRDGTETITIRNGAGEWQHNNVYSFLNRALPLGLWFRQTNIGKQFIYVPATGTTVHLPKTTSAPRYVVEHYRNEKKARKGQQWFVRHAASSTAGDDGLSVTFKRDQDGKFTLVGEAPKVMIERTRIDKTAKSAHKDSIKQVFSDAMTFYPMMQSQINWQLKKHTEDEIKRIAKEHKLEKIVGNVYSNLFTHAKPKLVHAIMQDTAHPLRHSFIIAAMFEIHAAITDFWPRSYPELDEEGLDKKRSALVRARFTRWINQVAGFAATVKVEQ